MEEVFNSIIQKKIGKMYEWRPIVTPYGQFEAIIYFSCPYWLAADIEDPNDFMMQLGEIGVRWGIENSNLLIQDRIGYYSYMFKPIWEATDINVLVQQEFMIKRTVFHLIYKHPLADLPINENDFEFMPPNFREVCPDLFVLVKTRLSFKKIRTMPERIDEIYIVNEVGDICIAKQEIDEYGTPWVIIRYEDGNVYQEIRNHTLDEMKAIWFQN